MKKKVIIFGVEDGSVNGVIEWIHNKGGEPVFVSNSEEFSLVRLQIKNQNEYELVFTIRETEYSLHDIYSFWYRNGNPTSFFNHVVRSLLAPYSHCDRSIGIHLKEESDTLTEIIHYLLEQKRCLGNFHTSSPNKLIALLKARETGLDIPDTYICSQKKQIQHFQKKHPQIITKAIKETSIFSTADGHKIYNIMDSQIERDEKLEYHNFASYTELLDKQEIHKLKPEFFPSLFQEALDKKVELRIFYLDGKCYSMAIFSQLDEQTSIDFRRYNKEKPNRNIPFQLPVAIEKKIKTFMNAMSLKTGSIDMVLTKDDRYVFLEVNPVGQFGMTSYPCRYNLDEKIADYLLGN